MKVSTVCQVAKRGTQPTHFSEQELVLRTSHRILPVCQHPRQRTLLEPPTMSQRLKNVWANHRTGCLVAGALAAGCGIALAVRAFRKRPRASPGARLLGVSERAIYEVSQRKRGGMTVRMCGVVPPACPVVACGTRRCAVAHGCVGWQVAFMARLHGPRVTLDALSVALAQLQHRHPALRSVVTDLGGGSKSKLSAMVGDYLLLPLFCFQSLTQ